MYYVLHSNLALCIELAGLAYLGPEFPKQVGIITRYTDEGWGKHFQRLFMPTISSDQVNYLIWRYLREEGLDLSCYAIDKETRASKVEIENGQNIPDGELVRLLLKGLQMVEVESAAGSGHALKSSSDQVLSPEEERQQSPEAEAAAAAIVKKEEETKSPAVQVDGLERVSNPDGLHLIGGVDSVFNSPTALVIAGYKSTEVYFPRPPNQFHSIKLECDDLPTCVEPLGVDIVGPDHCILVGYGSGCVRQWRFSESKTVLESVLSPRRADLGPVLVLRASNSGTLVAVSDVKTGIVNIWDLNQRQLIYRLEDPTTQAEKNVASDIVWVCGDTSIAVACPSGITIYSLPPAAPTTPTTEPRTITPKTTLKGHTKPVFLLAFEQLTQLLASGGDDGRVCVWNSQNPEPLRQITVGSSMMAPVSHVSWLGVHLLTSTTEGAVRLWDVRSLPLNLLASVDVGEPVFSLHVSKHMPTHIAVVCASGAKVYMLNPAQPSFTFVGEVRASNVECLVWGSDQSLAVTTRLETVFVRCPV